MIAVVLGTRPEIIKTAPVVLEAIRRNVSIGIIHTGQHYTPEMDAIFFRELGLPDPVAHAHVGSHPAPQQLGLMIQSLAGIFTEMKPNCVLVEGDTNSVLAGALTAEKMGIPVAHLEAGLRSDDRSMPEEINRILTDHISTWLFCPTDLQRQRLAQEGITHSGVQVTGNSIADAVNHFSEIALQKSTIIDQYTLGSGGYALLTLHRPSNVDDAERLRALIQCLCDMGRALGIRIVFPIHPRTQQALQHANIDLPSDCFIQMPPLGFLDLLSLEQRASMILTDSGGIQEEACILHIPCITLRANTERPETIEVGANILYSGVDQEELTRLVRTGLDRPRSWTNPFGDGTTAQHVIDILTKDV